MAPSGGYSGSDAGKAELDYDPDDNLLPLTAGGRLRLAWLSARFQALDSVRTWLYRRNLRTLNYNRRKQ